MSHTRREFLKSTTPAVIALLAGWSPKAECSNSGNKSLSLVDEKLRSKLTDFLTDICDWILTFNIESGILKKGKYSNTSIWVTGNFARILLVAYAITNQKEYLRAAIGWCDYFVSNQRFSISSKDNPVGYWHTHNDRNNIYLGDTGTATIALASACRFANHERKEKYIKALEVYARFVIEGCKEDPGRLGRGNSPGWISIYGLDAGAVGCGYYKGHVSRLPYTIATGTTGGGFFSSLYILSGNELYKNIATNAVKWIFKTVKADGEIPYILDNGVKNNWPYDTMTYCTEGILGTYWRVNDPEIREMIRRDAEPCVRWLVKTQNADGTWGEFNSADQKRSQGVLSLMVWYYLEVQKNPIIRQSTLKNCKYFLDKNSAYNFGVNKSTPTTSFVGLATAEMIEPGITFRVQ